jgi:alpha-L-rhamnosidase
MLLFRRGIELRAPIRRATGHITADSRYRLHVNGRRIGFGPAPCDPRWLDADPIDLTQLLAAGTNAIGAQVLFYGHGEGTWASGKPGFLFRLDVEYIDGGKELIVSDSSWKVLIDRAYPPGQYRRYYLRALQEEFDARLHPWGWNTVGFEPDERWLDAAVIGQHADRSSLATGYFDYSSDMSAADPAGTSLVERSIPALRETWTPAARLTASGRVRWKRDPRDWFEFRVPGSLEVEKDPIARQIGTGAWELPATDSSDGWYALFEFQEQFVGWPSIEVDAADGTILEIITQESHDPASPDWLDTHLFTWTRWTCREGVNQLQTFDYESLKWMQIHVRNARRPVKFLSVGAVGRVFPWPNDPKIKCDDEALQRLFNAALNTLNNCSQETGVDGMGRERQQYSGDCSHQHLAVRFAFGESRLSERFLRTFSQGLTLDGYFMDCWPAYDRLNRIAQRQIGGTIWGPLLDHGVGFIFDCWNYYFDTADLEALREPYPRLLRFAECLASQLGEHGLLSVENTGVPCVWMDHTAFPTQRQKQCAFNLYAAAMLEYALAPITKLFGDETAALRWAAMGAKIRAAAIARFWSDRVGLFVNNLPWIDTDGAAQMDDRSLATAILFDQCPGGNISAARKALVEQPANLGLSFPANACWRYWALAKLGRIDLVLNEFRTKWATMSSVASNNTLQEDWTARADSPAQFSHCAMAPLLTLYMDLIGIRPLTPGFGRMAFRPQWGDVKQLECVIHTARGAVHVAAEALKTGHQVRIETPATSQAEVWLDIAVSVNLDALGPGPGSLKRFALKSGQPNEFIMTPQPPPTPAET